jgi:hypothetical protein
VTFDILTENHGRKWIRKIRKDAMGLSDWWRKKKIKHALTGTRRNLGISGQLNILLHINFCGVFTVVCS